MEPGIAASELFLRLGDDELLVVDCRSEDDWENIGVHIPGALRMTVAELSMEARALPDDELIVLCGCTGGPECRRAYQLLRLSGREAVCLDGGVKGWIRQGFPTERHAQRARAGGLVPAVAHAALR